MRNGARLPPRTTRIQQRWRDGEGALGSCLSRDVAAINNMHFCRYQSRAATTNQQTREAINRYGAPAIFNTDQGCQFTSLDFTGMLKDNGIQISMDGKGCWRDNVFVERLWRNVKYEEVYLYAYDCVNDTKRCLEKYFRLYNQDRPHTALDDQTPDEFYFENLPVLPKAA